MNRTRQLWRLLPYGTRQALRGVGLLSILSSLAELATFGALAAFLKSWAAGDEGLSRSALVFAVFALGSAAARWWLQVRTSRLSAEASHALSVEAKRRLLGQSLAFHHRFHSARAAATLEKVRALSGAVLLPLVRLGQSLLVGAALTLAVLIALPPVAIAALSGIGLAYLFVARLSARIIRRRERGLSAKFDERAQVVQESFTGIRDVILDRLADDRLGRFARIDADIQHRLASFQNQAAAPRLLVEGFGMAAIALLVAVLAGSDASGAIAPIGLIAFAAQRLLPLAHSAASGWQAWTANRGMIDDVADALTLPVAERAGVRLPPFLRTVELRDASFAYPAGPPVLDSVSIALPSGSRTGLAGMTGAGKSTLADLFMGLLDPTRGHLLVDGAPVTAETAAGWQANIAHVGQHVFLLDASIVENVAMGRAVDRERVRSALRAAALEEFVDLLDEPVGENGIRISGGQRQRLALARAHYKRSPLWILDEATSALDAATERRVLDRIPAGTTLLVVSHRPAPLSICERIFELEGGHLRERAPVRAPSA